MARRPLICVTLVSWGAAACDSATVASPAEIVLSDVSLQFASLGETRHLSAVVRDADGSTLPDIELTWLSNDPAIATVTAQGSVTARSNGSATVSASAAGLSAPVTVIVSQQPAQVLLTLSDQVLPLGQIVDLDAAVVDALGSPVTAAAVTWSSSAPTVASVSPSGRVTALGSGVAIIEAQSGSASSSVLVEVPGYPVLVEQDFENGVAPWVGQAGGGSNAQWVSDPIEPGNQVVNFTRLIARGDLFSPEIVVFPDSTYTVSFRYLGIPASGSVTDNLGGFLGVSDDIPGAHAWIAGTVLQSGATTHLVDEGVWHTYSVEFVPGALLPGTDGTIRVMIEDWEGAFGIAGDAYFDNIILSGPRP